MLNINIGKKDSNFGFTGFTMFAMMIYAFVAVLSKAIIFDWKMAMSIISFVFAIEFIMRFI